MTATGSDAGALKDPAIRAKVIAMQEQHPKDWENLFHQAGPDGMLLLGSSTQPQTADRKTIAEIAKSRGVSRECDHRSGDRG